MAEISPEGKIENVYGLDRKLHNQPEGIAFYGDKLFISDEGDSHGYLSVYDFSKKKK